MAAAITAARRGDAHISLSPNGCVSVERTSQDGQIVAQRLIVAGKDAAVWSRTVDAVTVEWDVDRDGFAEKRITAQPDGASVQEVRFDETTKDVSARRTVTNDGDADEVLLEDAVAGGWQVRAAFTSPHEEGYEARPRLMSVRPSSIGVAAPCTDDQTAQLRAALEHAYRTGMACLDHYSAYDLAMATAFDLVVRDVEFACSYEKCVAGVTPIAHLDPRSYRDPNYLIHIDVHWECYSKLSEYGQASALWHELLHLRFGGHNRGDESSDRYREMDRTWACEQMCFGPNDYTQCTCATCLGSNKCDERCRVLPDCDAVFGYRCPCPNGPNEGKLFDTCGHCLTICPSGLGCFGYSTCTVEHVACGAAPTCP